jgi:nucleoside-diphosphate-sugar epimerase
MAANVVCITGASGFMGRALTRRYAEAGWAVRGIDRAAGPGGSVVAGDISRPGPWREVLDGADVVVHTAALVSNIASRDDAWRVNVAGTANVVAACRGGAAGRLLHVSSAAVYSHQRPAVVTEDHPVRPGGDVYGDTKIAAEQVVLQAHAAGDVAATIVRPTDVYGPGSRPWTILPVQMLRSGQVVLPARGQGSFNPIHVDDLTAGVVAAAEHPAAAGRVLNLSAGAAVPTKEFFGHYCRMLGIDGPRVAPTGVAVAVAAVVGSTLRALGRPSEANAATMRMLAATGEVSNRRAREVLGWEPVVDLAEGMARTERWLRDEGYL